METLLSIFINNTKLITGTDIVGQTGIEKHIKKDNKSHIFKNLHSATCFNQYKSLSFKIIDKANSKLDSKTKETLHISWRNAEAQQNNLALISSLLLVSPLCSFLSLFIFCCCCCCFCLFFSFLFHLLFSLSPH